MSLLSNLIISTKGKLINGRIHKKVIIKLIYSIAYSYFCMGLIDKLYPLYQEASKYYPNDFELLICNGKIYVIK